MTWKLQDFLDVQKKIDDTNSIQKLEEFCSKNKCLHKITVKGKIKFNYNYYRPRYRACTKII